MKTITQEFKPHYDFNADHDDEANYKLLIARLENFDKMEGARVGDWLLLPNGDYTRFTHLWDDHIQTGGSSDSYCMGKSGCLSYSGGLDRGINLDCIEQTAEVKNGRIWFFSKDWAKADNGVYYNIPCRVFKIKEDTPKDKLTGLRIWY